MQIFVTLIITDTLCELLAQKTALKEDCMSR